MAGIPARDLPISAELVRELLAGQAPHLARLPLTHLGSGWDNELFRLGEEYLVRLPRRELSVSCLANEIAWLPTIAGLVPVRVPAPVVAGRPTPDFPRPWAVVPWVPGRR